MDQPHPCDLNPTKTGSSGCFVYRLSIVSLPSCTHHVKGDRMVRTQVATLLPWMRKHGFNCTRRLHCCRAVVLKWQLSSFFRLHKSKITGSSFASCKPCGVSMDCVCILTIHTYLCVYKAEHKKRHHIYVVVQYFLHMQTNMLFFHRRHPHTLTWFLHHWLFNVCNYHSRTVLQYILASATDAADFFRFCLLN